MGVINQYSFTLVAGILTVLISIYLFRRGVGQREITALVALIIGFMVAYWFFNPGQSSSGGTQRTKAAIGAGKPVLLEFQSPY